DLWVQKTINTSAPMVGQNVTFLVTVSNAGPDAATNVAVRDQLPASLTFVAAAPSQGTYDNTSGIWVVGTLPNAGSATLQLIATVTGTVPFTNIAQVSQSDQYDPDSVPNNNNSGEDDQGSVDSISPTAIKLA